jgi:tetratricopeptide (TPR) repeat protein
MRCLRCLLVAVAALALARTASSQGAPLVSQHVRSQSKLPPDFKPLSAAAEKARLAARDEEAISLYQRALVLKPDWKEGQWYLGALLYEQERYSDARDLLRRFLAAESKAGPGWALLGLSEYHTREHSRALEHLQKAMQLGMGDRKDLIQSVFYFVGVLLTRFERYDEAMALYMGMVKSGTPVNLLTEPVGIAALRQPFLPAEVPTDRKELFRMAGEGVLAEEAQRREDAERIFARMAEAYPGEPGVHFLYGVCLLGVRPDEGIKQLKRELETSPYNFTAKLRLADEYLKEQQLDEAQRLAQEVVKIDPNYASGQLVLGEALAAKGDLNGGISALERARTLHPETVRTHWDLMRAYTKAGRTDDAKHEKEEIEKLTRTGPGQ